MLQSRPPIVVILGHVDHGKTTLLDYLRQSNIAAREAGGITQAIRSFQLTTPSGTPITFIDTPGHAAFSAMRSRGSQIADFAVLVVAADDGVQPQTKQSIEFIRSSAIPFVVAINKSDLATADPDRVKTQLTENQVVVEDYGGNVPSVAVSAKTGAGIPELLELLGLLAQLNPPQADPAGPLQAIVLESRLNPQTGSTAVVIVKNGTLSVGQKLFQTSDVGKVRSLQDSAGKSVTSASPSTPIEIIGLSQVPAAGSLLTDSLQTATTSTTPPSRSAGGEVMIVLKADVSGSLEAILASLPSTVGVLSATVGELTESDVNLAHDAAVAIIGFNIKVPASVAKLAEVEGVKIYNHKIIYELLETVDRLHQPQVQEQILGKATVQAEFKIGQDRIAGCKAIEGEIDRGVQVRLLRGDAIVGLTRIRSLKSSKSDIPSVKSGSEFGAVFHPYLDFHVGDTLVAFKTL